MKKLPKIPNTGARTMKKKNVTDLGPRKGMISLEEVDEESDRGFGFARLGFESLNVTTMHDDNMSHKTGGNEDTVTVFDLVHRGRQRDQFFKELTKKGQNPFRKNT